MSWWVASEEGMVSCVRLSTHSLFLVTSVDGDEYPELVSCIWGRYGALRKVSYSQPAFGYTLWKVKCSIGWWVVFEEDILPCLKLVTLLLLLVTFCGSEEFHWLLSCIWGRYGALSKINYSPSAFGYTLWKLWVRLVGELHLRRYSALIKLIYILRLLLHSVEVRSSIGWWVAFEECMVLCVRLITLLLLLVTLCVRWGVPLVGELYLRKIYCPA